MSETMHAVMLPWLALGHMIPFLHLSTVLAKAGIRVSFLSTPRNIQRLPKLPPSLTAMINFIELPLPAVDGLPAGAEATVDIPLEDVQYLKKAYDLLRGSIKQFIISSSPDWIIHDMIQYWLAEITLETGIPCIWFSVYSAGPLTFVGPLDTVTVDGSRNASPEIFTSPPEWFPFESSIALRRYEAIQFMAAFRSINASGVSDYDRVASIVNACKAVVIRSCKEFEGEYLELLEKLWQKPVTPVGLLPSASTERRCEYGEWSEVFDWLDLQKPTSVVFVGFGTECKLSKDQVFEIAHGLDLSDLPFLWALQKPIGCRGDADTLPSSFKSRTAGRGIVIFGWAPQSEILSHPSIGGSLFHSGWGSTIESLQYGIALIVLPLVNDQPFDARLLVGKGVAIEVDRNEDGSFTREEIARCLRLAMVDQGGEQLRTRAREMKGLFCDLKLHQDYERKFIEFIKGYKKKIAYIEEAEQDD